MDPIIKTMGVLTDEAKKAIEEGNVNKMGELMNINQGLLDSINVNTKELSRMVYIARGAGAIGSKITGAGGGGSIVALCPNKVEQVSNAIGVYDSTVQLRFSRKGVSSKVISRNRKDKSHKSNNLKNHNHKQRSKHGGVIDNKNIAVKVNSSKHVKNSPKFNKKSVSSHKNPSKSNANISIKDNKVIFKKKNSKTINNNLIDYAN